MEEEEEERVVQSPVETLSPSEFHLESFKIPQSQQNSSRQAVNTTVSNESSLSAVDYTKIQAWARETSVRVITRHTQLMIDANATVQDAITMMLTRNVSALLVRDVDDGLAVIRQRDIVRSVLALERDAVEVYVRDIMVCDMHSVRTISDESTICQCAAALKLLDCHEIITLDSEGRVSGIINHSMLFKHVFTHRPAALVTLPSKSNLITTGPNTRMHCESSLIDFLDHIIVQVVLFLLITTDVILSILMAVEYSETDGVADIVDTKRIISLVIISILTLEVYILIIECCSYNVFVHELKIIFTLRNVQRCF